MLFAILTLLACKADSGSRPCECNDNKQVGRETGEGADSVPSAETGGAGTVDGEPETIIITCTSVNMEVDLGVTPGEAPPRIAIWGRGDPSIEWVDAGHASPWVLIDDLVFTEEGLAVIPCDGELGYRGDEEVNGYIYDPFTVYIWR